MTNLRARLVKTAFRNLLIVGLAAVLPWLSHAGEGRKKVVILSASYGAGHNTSAKAIEREILAIEPNAEVKILLLEKYMRFGLGEKSKDWFNWVYQNHPGTYDQIFKLTMKSARGKTSAGQIPQPAFDKDKLFRTIVEESPDLVFSTHHISTAILIRLREEGKIGPENFKIGWVDTDFVYDEPFFYLNSLGIERTFMAHPKLTERRVAIGVPKSLMDDTGLPINPVVFEPFTPGDKASFFSNALQTPNVAGEAAQKEMTWVNGSATLPASHDVRLNPDVMTVTIASGKAWLGNYVEIYKGLVAEARKRGIPLQVVAVCGENEKNYRDLTMYFAEELHAGRTEGLTLAVSRFMDNSKLMKYVRSSQLFIGKSGSQSPIEAAIMGTPSVLLDVLGAQEQRTAGFFKEVELAEVVGKSEQGLAAARGFAMLEDPARMARVREAQKLTRESYTMKPIADFARDAFSPESSAKRVPIRAAGGPSVLDRIKRCLWIFGKGA
jgi:processive 1,2-diacylglycerol beta-glucosyltransferase